MRPLAPPRPVRAAALAAAFAAALLAAGCASTDLRKVYAPFENGDFARAAEVAEKVEPKKGVDTLWVHLERGAALLAGGRFAASIAAFQAADVEIGRLDERAVVSASEQTASLSGLVFDDRSTEYAGTDYDRILVCTSLAIGHALAGDIELAGVYARRQLDRQLAVEERQRARIERAEREREKASGEGFGQSYDQVVANEDFQQQMAELSTWTNPAYADFSVPYAYYVGAVLLGAQGAGDEMRDQARGLAGILPDSPVAQELVQAPRLPDYVFVLFENGLAPARVDASIMYVTSLGFTRVPIPRLAFQPEGDRAGSLLVLVDGREFETEPLDSMDEVVATDFADRLPAIFFRAVVAVVLKEVAAKQVQDSNDNVLTFIVASILKSVVAPDLRTWRTLPGEHQVAQVPVPSDGRVRLELLSRRGGARGGGPALELAVPTSGPSLVWARSTRATNLVGHAAPLTRAPVAAPPAPAPPEAAPAEAPAGATPPAETASEPPATEPPAEPPGAADRGDLPRSPPEP